ncbi:bifunctional DNA primase/polymerase [Streptomyces profundus]|uniref:bifunctional DNA primase/polymerase n=1 Tax=Streptomyces profundus TaxID=2867410 RepID=UPI001D16482F|nr:bifunctional DNA primase/polymerase [Streptomyces sp. MA3_2.13]UED85224.1 bifunctional DNA primase/polymerase [Streptomyces sp. MA3_2.13]
MREILGERRSNDNNNGLGDERAAADLGRALRRAALDCAERGWPVLPGVGAAPDGSCRCPRPECPVPGAHPDDPQLLTATTDRRMVRWWWQRRPSAPILLATGGRAPCAVSVPAVAGPGALAALAAHGLATGPVVAGPTRWSLLVRPYGLPELGELLSVQDRVPSSLRFHGEGGYVPLPPSPTGRGLVAWARKPAEPAAGQGGLPDVSGLLAALIEAGLSAPDQGSRLAY